MPSLPRLTNDSATWPDAGSHDHALRHALALPVCKGLPKAQDETSTPRIIKVPYAKSPASRHP